MREPMVGAEIWRPVMERAGYRCECRGVCGRKHGGDDAGRCGIFHSSHPRDHQHRLLAASFPGLAGIWAYCPDCYDRRLKLIKSQQPEHPPQEGLF